MLNEIKDSKFNIIKNFTPSWFASIMGTGILAVTSMMYAKYIPFLKYVAIGLVYFNIALFVLLLIPWTLRWIMFPKNAMADLKNPVKSCFYATIAIAMLVLASNFIVILKAVVLGEIFWFIGTFATITFAIIIPYISFSSSDVTLKHIHPGWYIPPVGLIVIPMAGSLIISNFTGLVQELVIFLNYFGWGAGFFIYLALMVIVFHRMILHEPLPDGLVPTVWINLGPIGVGVAALINLTTNSPFLSGESIAPLKDFGFLFWGFGVWWVLMAITITIKRKRLPFAMSWWAFTFPLGAYIAGTHAIASSFSLELVDYFGFGLYWLLVIFWSITLINTIRHSFSGKLFK
ncbi:MAG: tellurite-resistance/dicarboxylate transporter [Promethearchaeota archaeon]